MNPVIPLDRTDRKLQAFLSGGAATTNPTVTVIFYDVPQQTKTVTGADGVLTGDPSDYKRAPQFTVLAGATETDICDAPAHGTTRHIEQIYVYNDDTAAVTVIVAIDDNGTNRVLVRQELAVDETLIFDGMWHII